MFIKLFLSTFALAFMVSTIAVVVFSIPINRILERIIRDPISKAWAMYLKFAIYVTGISSGVQIWNLEKYVTRPDFEGSEIITLTTERWMFEAFRAIVGTLQGRPRPLEIRKK
ncbi:MAG: hypothetical protein ACYSUL_04195 [Planctomycetota bacterium]|jgi:hypothetical protein